MRASRALDAAARYVRGLDEDVGIGRFVEFAALLDSESQR
jgi:hypothetical protein